MNASIPDRFPCACQHVGLSGINSSYAGNEFGANADRIGAQWLKFRVESGTLSYFKHGRIYDAAPSNPHYYYFPSIAVNCAADKLLGFMGLSATNFIGAYYAWKPANGANSDAPVRIHAGEGYYDLSRWGDYSASTIDPVDPVNFWTIQQWPCLFADRTLCRKGNLCADARWSTGGLADPSWFGRFSYRWDNFRPKRRGAGSSSI